MEFLIVSGLSGGGKSRAADVLEDLDFYCVDNMPTALLTKFAELCLATRGRYEKVALVTDIRSQESFTELFAALDELADMGVDYRIADDSHADIFSDVPVTKLALEAQRENCEIYSLRERDESLESFYMDLVGGERHA